MKEQTNFTEENSYEFAEYIVENAHLISRLSDNDINQFLSNELYNPDILDFLESEEFDRLVGERSDELHFNISINNDFFDENGWEDGHDGFLYVYASSGERVKRKRRKKGILVKFKKLINWILCQLCKLGKIIVDMTKKDLAKEIADFLKDKMKFLYWILVGLIAYGLKKGFDFVCPREEVENDDGEVIDAYYKPCGPSKK